VTGGVTDAEVESADAQLVAVGQLAVRGGQPLGAQAEGERLLRCVIVQRAVRRMQVDRAPVSAFSRGTPSTWSMCAWVSQIPTGRTPSACSLWAIIPASSPGSMIAHSRVASSITK
jgi:hypothetical protein